MVEDENIITEEDLKYLNNQLRYEDVPSEDEIVFMRDLLAEEEPDPFEGVETDPEILKLKEALLITEGKLGEKTVENRVLKGKVRDLKGQLTTKDRTEKDRVVDYMGRIPPQNVSLEGIVLGLYLMKSELMNKFNQKYFNLMLYKESHRLIHQSMMNLGKDLDAHTLSTDLNRRDLLDKIGGSYYLQELISMGQEGNADLIIKYVSDLESFYLARKSIIFSMEMMNEAYNDKEIPSMTEWIRKQSRDILDLLPFRYRLRVDVGSIVPEVASDFDKLVERKGKPKISTGYEGLDRIMHGVIPNRLVMVGARTKIGKTTFSLNIADNVAVQGNHVLIFSYEMSRKELVQRLISKYAQFDSEKFSYFDEISKDELERVKSARTQVEKLPIFIEDIKPDIDYVINRCKQVKMMHPDLAMIVVDSIQSFAGYVPYQGNKSDVYYEILKKLKDVAKESRLTVFVNSQLKKDVEKRKDRKPRGVEDFSDCKGIPEVSDATLLLYRPEYYWPDKKEYQGWMSVTPAALRFGEKRRKGFRLYTDMKTSRIYEKVD